MNLNNPVIKPRESTPHIGIFGKTNLGKSSIINILTGQQTSIVSETPGTTTDPVKKRMEIPGIGPVILVDTAGIDDIGELGAKRIERSIEIVKQIDIALLLISDNTIGMSEKKIIGYFYDYGVPFLWIHNKSDITPLDKDFAKHLESEYKQPIIEFNALQPNNLEYLLEKIRSIMPETVWSRPTLLGELINKGDVVLLITPIDIAAPEGRLILPQVQTIRDILDHDSVAVVVKEHEAESFLKKTAVEPALVITDSSIFLEASKIIPETIPLTGFSILLARYKGPFDAYLNGTPKISSLKEGDIVLILESCTHHVSCEDIGRVKMPNWMDKFTAKKLKYEVVSGLNQLPRPITDYALVVQCGGCMITRKQMVNRLKPAIDAGIPVTNYGMAIAYMQGVYQRAILPFIKKPLN
ncbi:MAG: [FeFe] hydrogenase H-cluster maturation GTPase HydF [Bacteroidales bacterium]|jgi:[FeFe] hydrogenase H-cluster maturation GTPase HydF|nr:[FeFe] hydrogenase H-cluster maturation GTPase HydF [Bacteroidales bacterium]MDI9592900.1 [FeFe] hydrogenase H-cluster maturation GTPase HydF [Bacteroidota bacterium]HOF80395.1 [FeFe] hydrogenase H-cluster maturation GTPase HydF [Bacteroidales bacterium]HOR75739.1 [FeFe] hydrogenase H-cluster maturation GTPase HydF [Bacteroidales bacterium]HPL11146.1 [FeFe] hydrogenase H-cluster maturation GTPase HydF [Bacteroidales bacterium]